MQDDYGHAVTRVTDLLGRAHLDDGVPMLFMIYKNFNRSTGARTVQVIVTSRIDGSAIDISTEVATIIGCRYSQTNRGVIFTDVGMEATDGIRHALAQRLYGVRKASTALKSWVL